MAPAKHKNRRKAEYKEAIAEHNKEQSDCDDRLTNVIMYQIPEQNEADKTARAEKDNQIVTDLLGAIDVNAKPCNIVRLDKYDQSKDGSWPIKVCFENQATQKSVMDNVKKLQHAPENLKHISVCYDLTEVERITQRNLVQEAREQ